MDTRKMILYLYAETPIHAGTGTSLGAVDLPIQREKHTGYPIIQASSVKGALRNTAELYLTPEEIRAIFGGATGDQGSDFAGAMSPSDARILLFPVRALKGVFVWVTSPTVLERFWLETGAEGAPATPQNVVQVSDSSLLSQGQIMLEEYAYEAEASDLAFEWADYLAGQAFLGSNNDYWKDRLRTHMVILPDDEFRDFVRYATDIVTRIKINPDTKTVDKEIGALFTQELLPADSLLYSFVHITNSRGAEAPAQWVFETLKGKIGERLQIGADETVGRGRVRLNWQEIG